MRQHIYAFYHNLFGKVEGGGASISALAWSDNARVSAADNIAVTAPFSLDKIARNLKDMRINTALGRDGFPVIFYRRFWHMVGPQVLKITDDFTRGLIDIKRLNFGVLALLPKVTGVDNIRQFRPITLIDVSFHLFAKGLATRLAPVAHKIIHPNRTTFSKGRSILDGIAVLHWVIHEIKCSKEEVFILTIDFEKAYDRVRWDFLEEILHKKGCDHKWVSWMMQLVRGGQTVININGEVGPFFRNAQGVRQGDPISPLLFNLVSDALAAMLDHAKEAGHTQGVASRVVPGGYHTCNMQMTRSS